MNKISFVIPCYYAENTIREVVEEIQVEFPNGKFSKEIVLVNDGSKDGTYGELKKLAEQYSDVLIVNLSKNFGQDAACMAGYNVCSGEYILTLDDDGQNSPHDAHKLLSELEKGYDAVFAKYEKKKQSNFKNWGSSLNDKMTNIILGKPKDLQLNSYFGFNRFLCDEIVKYQGSYPYIWGLICRSTGNITNVEIVHHERKAGESTYTLEKMISYFMNGFTAFSVKPLRVSTIVGMGVSLVGFLAAVAIIIRTILLGDVPGWTSLIVVVTFLSGIQLIMLGMLGEYVGRIYINNNNAPQYIIHDIINKVECEEENE